MNSLIQHLHSGISLPFIALSMFSQFRLYTDYFESKKCSWWAIKIVMKFLEYAFLI